VSGTWRCPACGDLTPAEPDSVTLRCSACSCQFSVLQHPTATASGPPSPEPPTTPDAPPGYEIEAVLGHGGMGVVYRARHRGLGRACALKMILAGGHASDDDRQRFRTEAQAAARLQHPNIVQIFEIGTHHGQPFMALELCLGGSLGQKLAAGVLAPRDAAELVRTLAVAVQAAHAAKVVHRDLKPANVLLTADGQPKLTDFGLAKKLDEAGRTHTGAVLGTPSYMAPEQAQGRGDVGPAADVYALGGLLYACLTGRPPAQAATAMDTLLQVLFAEPASVRQLNAAVPRDLETIAHKCLQKDPARRYASAQALAADLGRFLRGEPIAARPVGAVERAARWVRRNAVVSALAALVVLALAVGVGVASYFAVAAGREATAARQAEADAKEEAYRAKVARHAMQIDSALRAWDADDLTQAERLLEGVHPTFGDNWETGHLRAICHRRGRAVRGHAGEVRDLAYAPDGKTLVVAGDGAMPTVRDAWTGKELVALEGEADTVAAVAFSPDGATIAAACHRGVRLWDARTGRTIRTFPGRARPFGGIAFRPDGTAVAACCHDGTVTVWDARTGRELLSFADRDVECLAFSPNGATLATGGLLREFRVHDALTGEVLRRFGGILEGGSRICFRPDGVKLASARSTRVGLWDVPTGQGAHWSDGAFTTVLAVAFSPDGKTLASAGADGAVRLWDAATGQVSRTLKGHPAGASGVAYHPGGTALASGGKDGSLRLWDLRGDLGRFQLRGGALALGSAAFAPDGATFVAASPDHAIGRWDARTGEPVASWKGHATWPMCTAYSPDGRRVVSGDEAGTIKVLDVATNREVLSWKGHTQMVQSICFSPDGRRVLSGGRPSTAPLKLGDPNQPDGPGEVKVWDADTGQEQLDLAGHTLGVRAVAFSPDGRTITSAGNDRTVKLWDARSGRELRTLTGHPGPVRGLAFHPDGDLLASASAGGDEDARDHPVPGEVRLWDWRAGEATLTLAEHGDTVTAVCFRPDGKALLTGGDDRRVRLYDVHTGQVTLTLPGLPDRVTGVAFSPDGKTIAAACAGRDVWLWTTR